MNESAFTSPKPIPLGYCTIAQFKFLEIGFQSIVHLCLILGLISIWANILKVDDKWRQKYTGMISQGLQGDVTLEWPWWAKTWRLEHPIYRGIKMDWRWKYKSMPSWVVASTQFRHYIWYSVGQGCSNAWNNINQYFRFRISHFGVSGQSIQHSTQPHNHSTPEKFNK